ncbi:hypothetical protein [Novosphingobium resinovorum]|uniref:Uncharacterized protein n=1 Tax=Novosphingobium resinovorum TaxID=158500 RepID=A0A1D8A512_9SPHN|nr:hypothetical protein [Novosphingobium resinovorum]AOR77195.1 hypothetical protein BES08_10870 [Novosphingobium resinovorum]
MKIPRLRTRNGRFLRKLVPTPADQHCWLIWSIKWHMWHRRGSTGGASGYTRDIAEAGLFPFSKASAYHDGIVNEAFHASEKVDLVSMRMEDVRRLLTGLEQKRDAAQAVAA